MNSAKRYPQTTFVISTDMIAYGGLIWSRKDIMPPAEAKKSIQLLTKLKKVAPKGRILAFATIPRDAGDCSQRSGNETMGGPDDREGRPVSGKKKEF